MAQRFPVLATIAQRIRSDNGPEIIAKKLRRWLKTIEVEPLYIEPGS